MPRLSMVTLAELSALQCPYCGRRVEPDEPGAVTAATIWGWCGVKLMLDAQPAGALLLAPTEDPGEAMLTSLWVAPGRIGSGYGRQLVQTAAAGLLEQKARRIVARGSRSQARCVAPPRDFLDDVGFVRSREDRLWRLDLERGVVDRPSLRVVFGRFLESLRPVSPPEPAGGAISGRNGAAV